MSTMISLLKMVSSSKKVKTIRGLAMHCAGTSICISFILSSCDATRYNVSQSLQSDQINWWMYFYSSRGVS